MKLTFNLSTPYQSICNTDSKVLKVYTSNLQHTFNNLSTKKKVSTFLQFYNYVNQLIKSMLYVEGIV